VTPLDQAISDYNNGVITFFKLPFSLNEALALRSRTC
jgi:hypothetical protein